MFPDLPVDDAFQRLLMEHVLPLPSRRCPDAVEVYLDNPDVLTLFKYFGSALTQVRMWNCIVVGIVFTSD